MNSFDLRQKFIQFFVKRGHKQIPATSLIPQNDPSVLFTTAGMQQFKKFYTNPNEASSQNVITCQPCFRTSDIDGVGDNTHLTFFEMLGNFSFGGYGKKEAIKYAWDFLTDTLKINKNRISASYYDHNKSSGPMSILFEKTDAESYNELKKYLDDSKIQSQGDDNFWTLGTIDSPGGPTVEFYVDGIEIWNLVFNEAVFKGNHWYWPKPDQILGVDTGMGLERTLVVLNNLKNVYETDILMSLIGELEEISGKKYQENQKAFRIIADHIKAAVFAINDSILPSNKDRGYIVRRLIRRAIVKANQLNIKQNLGNQIAERVFDIYQGVYDFDKNLIKNELLKEETKFRNTLNAGLKNLTSKKELSGQDLFNLYQSFGIPMEIAVEEVKNKGIEINNLAMEQFNNLMQQHQDLSRTASAGMFKGGLAGGGEQETKYHTATHLLLASLRNILGKDVNQKGANITAERIRLDFNYPEKLTDEQIKKIENWVNDKINQNFPVEMKEMDLNEAVKSDATSIPGFQYPEKVKVYSIGSSTGSGSREFFSREICGGPHVKNTGELGHFKIIKEELSSAGVRRIKAVLT